jgi:hypothetical protein
MRYADYLPPDFNPDDDHLEETGSVVTITCTDDEGVWEAAWGDRKLLGKFTGTRAQAIAWARERGNTICIYSLTEREMVELGPDDQ